MAKFIIEIHRNEDIAKGILKGWQSKVFLIAQKNLYKILVSAPAKRATNVQIYEDKTIIEEEGDKDYLYIEMRKFENFILNKESELEKDDRYRDYTIYKNNRWVHKVMLKAHKQKAFIKENLWKKILGDNTIQGWFARLGIFIVWRMEEKDENGKVREEKKKEEAINRNI